MRGGRSTRGSSKITRIVRIAVWVIKPRKSLPLPRPWASTVLSERQGTQTPSLAPRAPPSRLKPEMEPMKAVVFLRERKLGAGQDRMGKLGTVLLCLFALPFASFGVFALLTAIRQMLTGPSPTQAWVGLAFGLVFTGIGF